MKLNTKTVLSVIAALFLLTGCGNGSKVIKAETTSSKNNTIYGDKVNLVVPAAITQIQTQNAEPELPVLQGLAETAEIENNATVEKDILHIADSEMVHIVADEEAMGVTGKIKSYQWFDMDGNVLSEEKTLNRVLYYYPQFSHDDITTFIKTIVITTEDGKEYSKDYTVYVHKDALHGGQALLGPLAQAQFTLQKLGSDIPIQEGTTTQGDGDNISSAGIIPISAKVLNTLDSGYYILTVAGGEDIDRNDDLVWDETPTINHGTLHAILNAKQIQKGQYKVNIFTQAIYQYLSAVENFNQVTDEELSSVMDQLASELLAADLNGDGEINYNDVILWNPATDKNKLTVNYETEVAPYVAQIISGKSAALNSEYVVEKRIEGNKEILYTYDAHGNKLTETITENNSGAEPVISVIHYTNVYDDAGRLIEQKNSADTTVMRWIYDAQGNLTERDKGVYENDQTFNAFDRYYYKNGKLDSASLDRGENPYTITYETDQYGNVTKEVVLWNGTEYITEYTYEYDDAAHVLKKYKNGDLLFEQTWKRL